MASCSPIQMVLFAALLTVCADQSVADALLLKSGGRIDGQIQDRPSADSSDGTGAYVVRVSDRISVRVLAQEVGRVVEQTKEEQEYAKLLPRVPDTAAGHEIMAKWCHSRELDGQKTFHWEHVLRHDPDHEVARRVLGYSRIQGRWRRAEDYMKSQGFVRHRGSWRLPQQVALEERQQDLEVAQKTWRRDIAMWRRWLRGRRRDEAIQRLESIDDPLASAGLADLLKTESDAEIRELFVDLLARLATPAGINALIFAAIEDGDVEVRLRSIDHLRERGLEQAVRAWTGTLKSRNNQMVNRAGVALGRLGRSESVRPLIDALVTQHTSIVRPQANIRPSFGGRSDGAGGFNGLSVGGGPKKVRHRLQNKSVLEALVSLTGQNYRYSRTDWQNWYIQQRSIPDDVNLRRD